MHRDQSALRRVRSLIRSAALRMAMRRAIRSVRVEEGDLLVLTVPARLTYGERCELARAFGGAVGSLPLRSIGMLMVPEGASLSVVTPDEQ